jgi:hypothetical protein
MIIRIAYNHTKLADPSYMHRNAYNLPDTVKPRLQAATMEDGHDHTHHI